MTLDATTASVDGNDRIPARSDASPLDSARTLWLTIFALYALSIAAQLISLAFGREDTGQSFSLIVLPSLLYLSIVTLPACGLGIALGRRVGLGAPLFSDLLTRRPGSLRRLRDDIVLTGVLGLCFGGVLWLLRIVCAPYLPAALPALGHRGVLGGLAVSFGAAVAEEVWFRLGLMTLLVWLVARLTGARKPTSTTVWVVIALSSVGFGMAHLPQVASYGAASPFAVGGTVLGNVAVSMLYGWAYWRRSLLAAMVAHFSVDLVLHVLSASTW